MATPPRTGLGMGLWPGSHPQHGGESAGMLRGGFLSWWKARKQDTLISCTGSCFFVQCDSRDGCAPPGNNEATRGEGIMLATAETERTGALVTSPSHEWPSPGVAPSLTLLWWERDGIFLILEAVQAGLSITCSFTKPRGKQCLFKII